MTTQPAIRVENLNVSFGDSHVVKDLSFAVASGESYGIVGESGSGKSLTGRALLRLTPPGAEVTAQRLEFDGIDLMAADARTLRGVRGRRISMVMQDPKFSLNPVMTVGDQIAEALRVHGGVGRRDVAQDGRFPDQRVAHQPTVS